MIDLTDIEYVKAMKSNMRTVFDSLPGTEIMKLLERICGWYDFHETDRDKILIAHGKRQVLATIKTLLNSSAEQIVAITKEK